MLWKICTGIMADGKYGEKGALSVILDDSIKMIKADMKAMIDLHYRLGLTCDLSQIPLAKSKRICRNCGHRDTCPGGEDLVRAKLEQSALEMAKASSQKVAKLGSVPPT